jgi:hypothetical protein
MTRRLSRLENIRNRNSKKELFEFVVSGRFGA